MYSTFIYMYNVHTHTHTIKGVPGIGNRSSSVWFVEYKRLQMEATVIALCCLTELESNGLSLKTQYTLHTDLGRIKN